MEQDANDAPFIAVDIGTGQIIVALPDNPILLPDLESFVALVDRFISATPKIRSCRSVVTGDTDPYELDTSREHEVRNWAVAVDEDGFDRKNGYSAITATMGWSNARIEVELQYGFPLVLGFNLSLIDALKLQFEAERNGLLVRTTTMTTDEE